MNEGTVIRFVKDIIKDLFVTAPSGDANNRGVIQIEKANIC
jgi:hypothetical protein